MSTPDLLKRAEAVYFEVEGLAGPALDRALRERCAGDQDLLREVRSLLHSAERMGGFLSVPALGSGFVIPGAAEAAQADDLIGALLGSYRIESRLASGGMGTVYLASRADDQFEKQVAVKVVKRGMDSEEIVRRFRRERQTLAALNHPSIARLLDGGVTAEGRPYLVMEYVPGLPIDMYCDEHRLSMVERLRLFLRVCDAVRYAHQSLVVHRDLKPGNILVTADGTPKLLDFGIAKLLSPEHAGDQTIVEEKRLTPEYASPEQVAGGAITTATDVYSLGVILYELLTGHRPYRFETRTTAEFERVICREAPPAPSAAVARVETRAETGRAPSGRKITPGEVGRARESSPGRLRRRLRGDLDTIVLAAMHKEPSRRYSSAEALAEDIRRHLAGLPIGARKDTPAYLLRKFAGRHKVGVSIAAGVVLLLAGTAVVLNVQNLRIRYQRDEAYDARDQAEAITQFLQGVLSSADPNVAGRDTTIGSVLERAGAGAEVDFADRPATLAAVRSALGRAYLGLEMFDEAERELRAAYDIRLRIKGPDHHDTAEAMMDLAALRKEQGRHDEAERLLLGALRLHVLLRGEENLDTARVWNDLGGTYRAMGKFELASEAHRRALAIREKLGGRRSLEVAESLNNLAIVAMAWRSDYEEAQSLLNEALEIRRALLRPGHPLVIQSLQNVGVLHASRGDYAAGVRLLREAADAQRRVLGENSPSYGLTLKSLGSALEASGAHAEALPHLEAALRIQRERLGETDERTLATQAVLGQCLLSLGRTQDGIAQFEDLFARTADPDGAIPQRWRRYGPLLLHAYQELGRRPAAEDLRRRLGEE